MTRNWELNGTHWAAARRLHELESIKPLDSDNMFFGGIYCVLSVAEVYRNLVRVHGRLEHYGLNTPETVLSNPDKVKEALKKVGYTRMKEKNIFGLANWWLESDVPNRILEDLLDGKSNEHTLRNELAENAPGLGFKCSSMLMRM